jgi:hypothetical protein
VHHVPPGVPHAPGDDLIGMEWHMCMPAKCGSCGKATYSGCGMHVEQVLAGVPESRRCDCRSNASSGDQSSSFWKRLLG